MSVGDGLQHDGPGVPVDPAGTPNETHQGSSRSVTGSQCRGATLFVTDSGVNVQIYDAARAAGGRGRIRVVKNTLGGAPHGCSGPDEGTGVHGLYWGVDPVALEGATEFAKEPTTRSRSPGEGRHTAIR